MKFLTLNQIEDETKKGNTLQNSKVTPGRKNRRVKDDLKKDKNKINEKKKKRKRKEKKMKKNTSKANDSKKNFTQTLCRKIFLLSQKKVPKKMNLKILSKQFKQGDRKKIAQYLINNFRQDNIIRKRRNNQTSAFRRIRAKQSFIIFSFIEGNISNFTSLQKKIHDPNFIHQDILKQENKTSILQKEMPNKMQEEQLMKGDNLINQHFEQLHQDVPESQIESQKQGISEDLPSWRRYPKSYDEINQDSVDLGFHYNQIFLQQSKNQEFQKNASQQSYPDSKTMLNHQELSQEQSI